MEIYFEFEKEWVDGLKKLELFATIEEQCDCWQKYGDIKHNDGGNYHEVIHIYLIPQNDKCLTNNVCLVVYGDTRELFSIDERRYVIVYACKKPLGMATCKEGDYAELLPIEKLDEFIEFYRRRGYLIYYHENE